VLYDFKQFEVTANALKGAGRHRDAPRIQLSWLMATHRSMAATSAAVWQSATSF
jgi:hypothetical protein